MTLTNETQTIDADALRARLAETPADLRGRIEAALRGRDPEAYVTLRHIGPADAGHSLASAYAGRSSSVATGHTEADALSALARSVGLNADGSDPRAEVERLRRELAEVRDAAREYLAAREAYEVAWSRFPTDADDATWVRVNMEIGAADIRRDEARTRLAALVGGAS